MVSGLRRTFFFLSFYLWSTLLGKEEECTHTNKLHVRTGQISNLENKEEPCEGCGVRGRGSDAERAAGSSAQGGVWFLQTDKKDRSLYEHLVCAKCAVFSQRERFVSKFLIYFP